MNKTDLTNIVKTLDKPVHLTSPSEKIVKIDSSTGKIITESGSMFKKLLPTKTTYYHIKNNSDARNRCVIPDINTPIEGFNQKINIELQIEVQVSVAPGNEERFAEACFKQGSTSGLIVELIKNAVGQFNASKGADLFVKEYDSTIEELEVFIAKEGQKIGLTLNSNIELNDADKSNKIDLKNFLCKLANKDSDKLFDIELALTATKSKNGQARYFVQFESNEHLKKTIISKIKSVTKKELELADCYNNFDTVIKPKIRELTNQILDDFGLLCAEFKIKRITIPPRVDLEKKRYNFDLSDTFGDEAFFNYQIKIKLIFQLNKDQLVNYYRNELPDIPEWFDGKLPNIIHAIVDINEIAVFKDLSLFESLLEERLLEEVLKIGVSIENFKLSVNIDLYSNIKKQRYSTTSDLELTDESSLPLKITFKATLEQDNLETFHDAGYPDLELLAANVAQDYIDSNYADDFGEPATYHHALKNIKDIESNILEFVKDELEETGLQIKGEKCQNTLDRNVVKPDNLSGSITISIVPDNTDIECKFILSIESEVQNDSIARKNPIKSEEFHKTLITSLEQEFNKKHSLYELRYERTDFEDNLESVVTEKLTKLGRKLSELVVTAKAVKDNVNYNEHALKDTFESNNFDYYECYYNVTIGLSVCVSRSNIKQFIRCNMPKLSDWFKKDFQTSLTQILNDTPLNELNDKKAVRSLVAELIDSEHERCGIESRITKLNLEFPRAKQNEKFKIDLTHEVELAGGKRKPIPVKVIADNKDIEKFYNLKKSDAQAFFRSEILEKLDVEFTGIKYEEAVTKYDLKIKNITDSVSDLLEDAGYEISKFFIDSPFSSMGATGRELLNLQNFPIEIQPNNWKEHEQVLINVECSVSDLETAHESEISASEFQNEVKNTLTFMCINTFSLYEVWYQYQTKLLNSISDSLKPLYEKYGRDITTIEVLASPNPNLIITEQGFAKDEFDVTFDNVTGLIVHFSYRVSAGVVMDGVSRYVKANLPPIAETIKKSFLMETGQLLDAAEINDVTEKHELIDTINQKVKSDLFEKGINISSLNLSLNIPEFQRLEKEMFEYEIDEILPVPTSDKMAEIKFKNKIAMHINDFNCYFEQGSKAPEPLIKDILHKVFRRTFFELNYANVVLKFSAYEGKVKEEVKASAQEYGYGVEQFIIEPDLAPLHWKEQFSVEMTGNFSTKRGSIVPVKVIVFVLIDDLSEVEEYLDKDLKAEISKTIHDAVNSYMIGIELHDFYMRFDDQIQTPLDKNIREKLEAKFSSIVIESVTPQMDRTKDDVLSRQEALLKEKGRKIIVTFEPLSRGYRQTYSLSYSIAGVPTEVISKSTSLDLAPNQEFIPASGSEENFSQTQQTTNKTDSQSIRKVDTSSMLYSGCWDTFYDKRAEFNADDVEGSVTQYFEDKLKSFNTEDLLNQDPEQHKFAIRDSINDKLKQEYGIVINILSISRERTDKEKMVHALEDKGIKTAMIMEEKSMERQLSDKTFNNEKLALSQDFYKSDYESSEKEYKEVIKLIEEKQIEINNQDVDFPDDEESDKLVQELESLKKQRSELQEKLSTYEENSDTSDYLENARQDLLYGDKNGDAVNNDRLLEDNKNKDSNRNDNRRK